MLAGYTVDHAIELVRDGAGRGGPDRLSEVDAGAAVAECRAMADDPEQQYRLGEHIDAVRRCHVWDAQKAAACALATLSRGIDGRWNRGPQMGELLDESNVLVDMRGIAVLRWRSRTMASEYSAYLEGWRARMPVRHGVGLREIDDIEADFEMVETYLAYTVPRAFETASPRELQASFRPRSVALVSREGGVSGRDV